MLVSQAHKLYDHVHDIQLSTVDAKTVGEVKAFLVTTTIV